MEVGNPVGKIANITIGKDKIKIEIDLKSSELLDTDYSNNSLKFDRELPSEKNEDIYPEPTSENIDNNV